MATMVQPMSCLSIVTVAVVLSSVGSLPALVIWNDRAIVKQLACAAAISSSGFVPALPSSDAKRVLTPYGASLSAPESVLIVPLPLGPVPCQTAVLVRLSAMGSSAGCIARARQVGTGRVASAAIAVWPGRTRCG